MMGSESKIEGTEMLEERERPREQKQERAHEQEKLLLHSKF